MSEEKKHISEKTFEALIKHQLSKEETVSVLEHISSCTYCAEVYAKIIENDYSLTPSPDFKEIIMKKSKRFRLPKKYSQRAELWFYSLRVGIAMSFTLLIIYSNMFQVFSQAGKKNDFIFDHSFFTTINNNINNFTTKLINLEVNNDENKKK